MAPKSGSKAPAKQAKNVEADTGCEDAVIDALESIFDRVGAYVEESYMQSRAISAAVDLSIESSLCLVDMAYIVREEHPMNQESLERGSWDPDVEPEPCIVDTWIRGAIPYELKKDHDFAARMSLSRESAQASSTNVDSSNGTGQGEGKKGMDLWKNTLKRMKPTRLRQTKPKTPRTSELESQLREEIANRKRQAQVAERTKKQDEEAKAKLEMMKRELHGKEYTYDHHGKMVQMAKFNPSKLPPAATEPDIALLDASALAEQDDGNRSPAQKGPKPKEDEVKRLTATKKCVKGRKTAPDFVEKPSEAQPSALETMRMSRGVTLKQGGASKAGPARLSMAGQMTKSEYCRFIDRKKYESRGTAGGRNKEGTASSDHRSQDQSSPPKNSPKRMSPQPLAQGGEDAAKRSTGKTNFSSEGQNLWARDGRPKDEPETITQKSLNVDLYITSQPDWGSPNSHKADYQPPDVPISRPTARDFEKALGRSIKMPRARAPQLTVLPSRKERDTEKTIPTDYS